MEKNFKIFVINPGSTSTKIAVYENETPLHNATINHPTSEIAAFKSIWEQYDFRLNAVLSALESNGHSINEIDCLVCRGGNTAPVSGGIYEVSQEAIEVMRGGKYGTHPTALGNLIAYNLGKEHGLPVITCDPPITDEFCDYARYSGIPQISRLSSFHALNQKATARKVAAKLGGSYEQFNMVVVHMGGGISVGAHEKGRVVDCNNALDGDGPFSPERAGALPNSALIRMCFSGEYTLEQMLKLMTGGGGLVAYLGTTDAKFIEDKALEGDKKYREVYMAMAYQVVKEIGSMAAVLGGKVDAVAITGSLARSPMLMDYIREHVSFIAPIHVIPGENEMEALAAAAMRYMSGAEKAKQYKKGCGL